MQLDAWHIDGDGFHFGRHGLGQEESGWHIPSDSLLSACIARLAELRGPAAVQGLMDLLRAEHAPFVLSSAFARAGPVYFFPTPLRPAREGAANELRPKDLKKIIFVSSDIFRSLLGGRSLAELAAKARRLQGGAAIISEAEWPQLPEPARAAQAIWDIQKRPRVALGRMTQNSQIYFTGRTAFQPDCGLWFGVRWLQRTPALEDMLAALFAELGDAGLGGERSAGFGRCAIIQAGSMELPEVGHGPWVTLSRFIPRAEEANALQDEAAAYAVETVGGWVDSPVSKSERRRTVRMIAEGAVLGPVARAVPGQVADVQPDYNGKQPLGHAVWRSGLALAVGASIELPASSEKGESEA
jgi:CRISPR-associated protein Csm4